MASSVSLRLIMFDCDGTLVDSQHTIFEAMSAAFASVGAPAPPLDRCRRVIGLPLRDALAALVPPEWTLDPELLTVRYREAFHAVRARAGFEEPLFPGALAALDALEAAGCLLGVATGKGRSGLERTLGQHGVLGRFVTLQTSDRSIGKPHPDMLLRAMAETGVGPAACVMIGDTTFDVLMARAARTQAIGVAWGYHGVEELSAAGAHAIVEGFAELPVLIRDLLP